MKANFPIALTGMRIGLLGGSFDPAHDGHVQISEFALRRFGLDRVWWLVSPGNPLKSRQPAPIRDRIRAARSIVQNPKIEITDIEARLDTRLTADTIARLRQLYSGVEFVWLMGSDNLVQFDQWERWQDIAAQVPIGVLARPGSRLSARCSRAAHIMRRWRLREVEAPRLSKLEAPAWVLVNLPMSPLSSTAIRTGLRGERE